MKKWLLGLLFIVPLRVGYAAITDEGVNREKAVTVHFSTTVNAGASPSFLLISLSTPTLFPHQNITTFDNGEIDISHLRVQVDKVAASTGSIKVGVVSFINSSTSTVVYFYTKSYLRNVSNTIEPSSYNNLTPSFIRCRVIPAANPQTTRGTTPYILSNERREASFIYNSTTTIASAVLDTSIVPQVGDVILEIVNSDATNAVTVTVDFLYHAERR